MKHEFDMVYLLSLCIVGWIIQLVVFTHAGQYKGRHIKIFFISY